jgi:integrase
MATIRRRGDSWQAQIRRAGHSPLTRTFSRKDDAQRWARSTECDLDRAPRRDEREDGRSPTLGELLKRYEREVTPSKRSNDRELDKIRVISRYPITSIKVHDLKPRDASRYRDERLDQVSPATVRRELAIIKHCVEIAIREWGIPVAVNPIKGVKIPNSDNARSRRLNKEEMARFMKALSSARAWYVKPIVIFALETGMRRGEILAMRQRDFRAGSNLLHIPRTKNGHARTIPLTKSAISAISFSAEPEVIFPVTIGSLRQSWLRLLRKAHITDFRFHDLRHEALSRYAEYGLSMAELSLISGHKTAQMLLRYTHIRPENVAAKIARLTAESE